MNMLRFTPEALNRDLTLSPIRQSLDTVHYEPFAVLPDIDNSRGLSGKEYDRLLAGVDTPAAVLVEVFPAPRGLLEAVVEYSSRNADPNDDEAKEVLKRAGAAIGGEYATSSAGEAGRLSATTSPLSGLAPGLHFDGRDGLSLERRFESRRRLGVNAGPGDRWLFVCTPDVVAMCGRLGISSENAPRPGDWHKFAMAYPEEVDCIRIPIPAESAYLLGTDIAVHEGSTFGANERSHAFFWLGHWAADHFDD